MAKKQFKAESKKLLSMMINSIYTHKEIFLRELISNASDAIDKLYFRSLTDTAVDTKREDYEIRIDLDKDARTITITDNGCGMTEQELENNLGVIAKSGSNTFKSEHEKTDGVEIIGQFGVGFYSSFMVSDEVTVVSRAYGEDTAHCWYSKGVDGYTVTECEKDSHGTVITLHIKEDTPQEKYSEFLDEYKITSLVKRYSDYIRYPVRMMQSRSRKKEDSDEYETYYELATLNSMVPLWRKNKNEIKDEDYNAFYSEKFYDFEPPAKVIHSKTEGEATYDALMFIPQHAPYDYYTKEYEKGLQLYSNGVLIMDKCADLLPDHFSFVKGLVDSADLSLNISREMLQHDHQLKIIAKNLEKKILTELKKMLKTEREKYEQFWKAFGIQIKFGAYSHYGVNKDTLKPLILFDSSFENKLTTLSEYVERMATEQQTIYYACGESIEAVSTLPQTDAVRDKGYEILYLTENVDEFVIKMLGEYEGKKFANICTDDLDLDTDEEKDAIKNENESNDGMLNAMKEALKEEVIAVRFTNKLKNHPVALSTEGEISIDMAKALNAMPGENKVKAQLVLEINASHAIADKLKSLYESDKDTLSDYSKVLYNTARLISGMPVENPTELSNLICKFL